MPNDEPCIVRVESKAKPECKVPFSAKLLNFKSEVDKDIHIVNAKILRIFGLSNSPDGLKKKI